MIVYLLRRLFLLAFVFIALSILAFSLGYMFPGNPLQNFSGLRYITAEQTEILTDYYRLNDGYIQQYLGYLSRIFTGDWGLSLTSQQPLLGEIRGLMPATLELTTYALLISFVIGIPLGIVAAIKPEGKLSRLISGIAVTGYSIPIFW
ncbi:MAG TPA: ABC transporter permease [Rheinheimera sp.]|nr:ABC transporter permease [Rheinheimera sp.]